MLARHAGTATELGGLAAFLATRPDWQATVLRCTSAQPGGPLTEQAFRGWLDEVLQGLASGGSWDGVHLSLQGACVAAGEPAADLAIIRAVRAAIGATPLVASFDFHGNLAPEIATLLDGASVYRTYPHIDMAETATRALRLLANKAKNHFRAAFAGRCSAIVDCDCPGPAALDLAALPFRHVPLRWRTA